MTGGAGDGQSPRPTWRPVQRVQPGWLVRMEGTWHKVRIRMDSEDLSRRRFSRVITEDGYEALAANGVEVATLTKAEARKAGLS